jgi:anthranilate phosphoribosyltransferase
MNFNDLFTQLNNGTHLSIDQSISAVKSMMDGTWTPEQIGSFLLALNSKGESAGELAGFAAAMKNAAIQVPTYGLESMDTCGTGGDKKGSFNISTLTAFVLAGCGIRVAKHGNRAASSSCGSADLLESMGIRFRLHPEEAAEALAEIGFAFLFAPDYHPATRSVVAVRRQLGTPTIFNLLGPLTNPANPKIQLVGVYKKSALPLMVEAVRLLDSERRIAFVHGDTGWDEATPSCNFSLHHIDGVVELCNAPQFGISACEEHHLRGGSPAENAQSAWDLLAGNSGPHRDAVRLNALLGYRLFDPSASCEEALRAVTQSIDSGAAKNIVTRLKERFPGNES